MESKHPQNRGPCLYCDICYLVVATETQQPTYRVGVPRTATILLYCTYPNGDNENTFPYLDTYLPSRKRETARKKALLVLYLKIFTMAPCYGTPYAYLHCRIP